MEQSPDLPAAGRIRNLLDHLGITRAHFVVHGFELRWPQTLAVLQDRIAGLGMFVHTDNPNLDAVAPFGPRVLAITGERRTAAVEEMCQRLAAIPIGRLLPLSDYSLLTWSDVAKERSRELAGGMAAFFEAIPVAPAHLNGSGEHEGVTYKTAGSGPPLVLFPLGLSPSQWEPVLPALQERFCTIQLGGPYVGPVAQLEFRASGAYLRAVRALFDELEIEAGQSVLEVGCGSGALVRWLASHVPGIAITAADVNRYLLGEAQALARRAGLDGKITFKEGNALALPFPDASFDRVYSSTVMEEVDADRMLAELVRVVRPGGRVGVMTRSVDRPRWLNAPLPEELRPKTGYLSGSIAPGGCADASLYDRFPKAGLIDVRMMPQLAIDERTTPAAVEQLLASRLDPQERRQLHDALQQAVKSGTFFVAAPYHAAVGTKPL